MEKIYKRKLTYCEAKRHYVYIEKKKRDLFPSTDHDFDVVVNNMKLPVKVDKQNRIWAALFWDKLPHFRKGDTIIFSKNADGSFNVRIEK